MAIPGQRKPGQTGGYGGHRHNTAASRGRGGSPRAGGGGKKPPGKGCAVLVIAFLGGLAAVGYTVAQLVTV